VRALVGGEDVEAGDGARAPRTDVQAMEESGNAVIRLGGLRREPHVQRTEFFANDFGDRMI
jgi:hypothetical protein